MRDANIVALCKNKGECGDCNSFRGNSFLDTVGKAFAFIDLSKAFCLVNRSGLFQLLRKIGCPPNFLAILTPFH